MKIKWLVCSIIILLLVTIGTLTFFITKSKNSDSQNKANVASQTEVSNSSNNNSKETSQGETNIEYFENLKPIKNKEVNSIKFRLSNGDFYTATLPITGEAMNKLAPFEVLYNNYNTWEDLLNSNETIPPKDFVIIYSETLYDLRFYSIME